MPRISKHTVDAVQAGSRDIYLWDEKLTGFGVKVTPAGKKVFLIQYRIGGRSGRTRRITLGHLGPVTADEARTRAKALLALIKAGRDPAADRDRQKAELTLGDVLERFLAEHVKPKLKPITEQEYRRTLRLHVTKSLRSRRIGDIAHSDIADLHHGLRATPVLANKLLAILSKAFNWADKHGLRGAGQNPCRHIDKYPERKRERFLSPAELATLGTVVATEERSSVAAAIRLLLFTGARLNEIMSAQWDWVDMTKGTIRLPDSKTGAKTIYLNAPALEILRALARVDGNPFIIVGEKEGTHLVNLQKPWRTIREAANLGDVRLHDLRHTFASVGVGGGASLAMVGALLGHSQPQTTDRYAHLASDPMRAASDAVARAISDAMNGKRGNANVVPISNKLKRSEQRDA